MPEDGEGLMVCKDPKETQDNLARQAHKVKLVHLGQKDLEVLQAYLVHRDWLEKMGWPVCQEKEGHQCVDNLK